MSSALCTGKGRTCVGVCVCGKRGHMSEHVCVVTEQAPSGDSFRLRVCECDGVCVCVCVCVPVCVPVCVCAGT